MKLNLGWAYEGVNGTVPRNTGQECFEFLTPLRRIVESIIVIPLCIVAIKWSVKRLKPIHYSNANSTSSRNQLNHNNQIYYHHHEEHREHQRLEEYRLRSSPARSLPSTHINGGENLLYPPLGKQLLLVILTLTIGVELGFKFATRTVIYILNPCHITTIIQVSHFDIVKVYLQ